MEREKIQTIDVQDKLNVISKKVVFLKEAFMDGETRLSDRGTEGIAFILGEISDALQEIVPLNGAAHSAIRPDESKDLEKEMQIDINVVGLHYKIQVLAGYIEHVEDMRTDEAEKALDALFHIQDALEGISQHAETLMQLTGQEKEVDQWLRKR